MVATQLVLQTPCCIDGEPIIEGLRSRHERIHGQYVNGLP